jgi:hypothetical protein
MATGSSGRQRTGRGGALPAPAPPHALAGWQTAAARRRRLLLLHCRRSLQGQARGDAGAQNSRQYTSGRQAVHEDTQAQRLQQCGSAARCDGQKRAIYGHRALPAGTHAFATHPPSLSSEPMPRPCSRVPARLGARCPNATAAGQAGGTGRQTLEHTKQCSSSTHTQQQWGTQQQCLLLCRQEQPHSGCTHPPRHPPASEALTDAGRAPPSATPRRSEPPAGTANRRGERAG